MAVKDITPQKVDFNSIKNITLEVATAAEDGCKFIVPKDIAGSEYLTIIAQNTGAAAYDVYVKAPANGGYAAADSDLILADVPANGIVAIRVETAKYANNDGSIIVASENVAVKFAVIY